MPAIRPPADGGSSPSVVPTKILIHDKFTDNSRKLTLNHPRPLADQFLSIAVQFMKLALA